MSNLKLQEYGSSGHRQGDFREDTLGVREFREKGGTSLGEREWLDSDDVCRLLGISPRTLQTMRENGTLAYTKISHKVYYRPEDVKAVFPVVEMKRCIAANKGRYCNTDTVNL